MADTAVIVVDMQRGLVQRARPAYRLDDVVSGINRLTAAARAANAPVCFVQHDGDADDDIVPGTRGWDLHDGLIVDNDDWRIRKRASDAFHDTPLAAQLDVGVAVVGFDDLVGQPLDRFLYFLAAEFPAHEAFDREDGVLGVGNGLAFGDLADEPFPLVSDRNDRRSRAGALRVRNHNGIAAAHDGDARIGRA